MTDHRSVLRFKCDGFMTVADPTNYNFVIVTPVPRFYCYTEGTTRKILDVLSGTLH